MINRKFVFVLIERGFKPYVKGHWVRGNKAGTIIAFRNNPTIYECSNMMAEKVMARFKLELIK